MKQRRAILLGIIVFVSFGISPVHGQWVQTNGPTGGQPLCFFSFGRNILLSANNGMYRSTDSGASWIQSNSGLFATAWIWSIDTSGPFVVVAPADGNAQDGFGTFASSDSGATWSVQSNTEPGAIFTLVSEGGILFASSSQGLFFSGDNGADWVPEVNLPGGSDGAGELVALGRHLFVRTDSGSFHSSDAGVTWHVFDTGPLGGRFLACGPDIFDVGYFGGYVSHDTGMTWVTLPPFDQEALEYYAAGPVLFLQTNPTMYRSLDAGTTWLPDIAANWMEPCGSFGNKLFAKSTFGMCSSTDSGVSWTLGASGFVNSSARVMASIGPNIFCGVYGAGVYRSSDSGDHWILVSPSDVWSSNLIGIASMGNTIYALSNDTGLYSSTDAGMTWFHVLSNFDVTLHSCFSLSAVDSVLYIGTADGLYRSSDGGRTWNTDVSFSQSAVLSVAKLGSILYAGTNDDGMWISNDNAATWHKSKAGFPDAIDAMVSVGSSMLAVGDGGVFVFGADNNSWSWGYDSLRGFPLSITTNGNYAFVGTDERGVWRRPISQMTALNTVSLAPLASTSLSVYPNPFTDRATIHFSSPESGMAVVSIVNALGMGVARIFSGNLNAGEHSFLWDGHGFAPGMYECLVKMNGRLERVPIVLE